MYLQYKYYKIYFYKILFVWCKIIKLVENDKIENNCFGNAFH